jgi:hypothetical protein
MNNNIPRRKQKRIYKLNDKDYKNGKRKDKKRRNPKPYGGYLNPQG